MFFVVVVLLLFLFLFISFTKSLDFCLSRFALGVAFFHLSINISIYLLSSPFCCLGQDMLNKYVAS